jgi:ceramide glucosyltransferase
VTLLLLVAAFVAGAYQVLALAAAVRHLLARDPAPASLPPVSILKPVQGLEPHFYEAIRSHAAQDYPEFEMLFGVRDPADPAVKEIERLQAEFPERRIRIVRATTKTPNAKVGVLIDLAAEASHPLLLASDSDIRVPSGYLKRLVAPLEDPAIGLVTCLYGALSDELAGRWEAIGIASDFAPSVLVARSMGVREFGLGSTLLFRAADLRRVGGFETVAEYLADDYQLAKRFTELGLRVKLSQVTVDTWLQGRSWSEVWAHQVRWARTVRVSRPGGYAGLPVTQASLWSLAAALAGMWWVAVPLLALRLAVGWVVGVSVLKNRLVARHFYLIPLRDLWGFAVWVCGLFGDTVVWRGERLRLTRGGRIRKIDPAADEHR